MSDNLITLTQYKSVRQVAAQKKRRNDPEHQLQVAVVRNFDRRYPTLAGLLYAIPNGGHRNKATAAKMKAEGVRRGVPDLHLPVARGGWHGLYVELKVLPNQPTSEQKSWMERLTKQGYYCQVAYTEEQATELFRNYLTMTSDQ